MNRPAGKIYRKKLQPSERSEGPFRCRHDLPCRGESFVGPAAEHSGAKLVNLWRNSRRSGRRRRCLGVENAHLGHGENIRCEEPFSREHFEKHHPKGEDVTIFAHVMSDPMEVFLDARTAQDLLDAASAGPSHRVGVEVSLDLNLTRVTVDVDVEADFVGSGSRLFSLTSLQKIIKTPRKVFSLIVDGGLERGALEHGAWEPLEVFTDHHYQLVPTEGAPTVEVDGIQMHRTSGVEPFEAARRTVESVVRPDDRVLDTCGGLGYSAMQAARRGASEVISSELSEEVLFLRRRSPWSRLEAGLPIRLEKGDVFQHLTRLSPGSLDSIVHDPPRYSLSPELYSEAFYLRLRDLLRKKGRLFHYTGNPYSRGRGRDFLGGVLDRLRRAGFDAEPRPDLQGFVCQPIRQERW